MKNIKKNATILTVLLLIKKLSSILYKIPYQNLTGDAGFYVFQQVYPFIAIVTLLTSFVFPTIIGNLLQQHHYHGKVKDKIKKTLWIFSSLSFILIFLGHRQIALIMGDVLLAPIIQISAVNLLFVPFLAYKRGVLQSRTSTIKTLGYSVLIEQLVRVFAILIALHLTNLGGDIYFIALVAVGLSLAGPVLAVIHLFFSSPDDTAQSFLPFSTKIKLMNPAIQLFLSAGILVIFNLIDNFLVLNTLLLTEAPPMAIVLKGILERGLPILQAGTFYVSGIVSLTLSSQNANAQQTKRKNNYASGLRLLTTLAIPSSVGLIVVMPHLNEALYMNQAETFALRIMMIQVFLYAVIVFLAATLTKDGKKSYLQTILLIGIFIKLISTVPLTRLFSITGTVLSSTISLFIMFVCLIFATAHWYTPKLIATVIGNLFSTLMMFIILFAFSPSLQFLNDGSRMGHLSLLGVKTLIGIAAYFLVFGLLIFILKTIAKILKAKHRKRVWQQQRQNQAYKQEIIDDDTFVNQETGFKLDDEVTIEDYHHKSTNVTKKRNHQGRRKKMRLDKFLKVSRIIKRRQSAKEASDAGKISVNGKVAKSSTTVSISDEITLHYATRIVTVRVKDIKDSTKKEDAAYMYETLKDEPLS